MPKGIRTIELSYEEADLLDTIREAVLHPTPKEEDYILENLYLTLPVGLC